MSQKAVDKFLQFLDERKLTKLTPGAFTPSEIITYATQNDFHFSREALTRKIQDLAQADDSSLSDVEKAWKNHL